MRLFAFSGFRYAPAAGDPGPLVAPPYDQINDRLRDRLQAQSPHQFAHLIKPLPGAGGDPYRAAAELHARWLASGVVSRDEPPALYPYTLELAQGGRRLGVLALVGIEDATLIRPHEQTLDKPLADRTALLAATRIDLEPALLLAEDEGRLEALLREDVATARTLVEHVDSDGHRHRLAKVDDPARIARYQEALAGRTAAIADGHHRYKVAQRYAKEHGITSGAAAAKLAVVTSMTSPALSIDPIHRAFQERIDLKRTAGLAVSTAPFRGGSGAELAAAVAAAAQPAIGVWVSGHEPEIWQLHAMNGTGSNGTPQLAVELFQKTLLPALGLPQEAATDGTVVYRASPDELYRQVAGGELGTGIWLPPMQPAEFAAAIAHGDMLPPKSTRFLPKVMSGLAWAGHDARLL